jgi:hypothetical protein
MLDDLQAIIQNKAYVTIIPLNKTLVNEPIGNYRNIHRRGVQKISSEAYKN